MLHHEILFGTAVFVLGSLAGMSRCVHNGDWESISHTLSVGGVSGFLSYGVVGLVANDVGSAGFETTYYLAIASIVGLAGKEQTRLISMLWRTTLTRLIGRNAEDKGDGNKDA